MVAPSRAHCLLHRCFEFFRVGFSLGHGEHHVVFPGVHSFAESVISEGVLIAELQCP